MASGTFHLKTATNKQPYWVLRASNGEPLCKSETYSSHAAALKGIEACKKYAQDLSNFGLFVGADNLHYWNLKSTGNHEKICQSEGYTSKQSANSGALACQKDAPNAVIKDDTLANA